MNNHLNQIRMKRRIRGLSKLSTLPQVALDLISLLENQRASVADLAQLISTDQVLTARVLKLANSSNFGFKGQISTLNLALVVVGFNSLKNLILSISATDLLSQVRDFHSVTAEKFFVHGLIVGTGARVLAEKVAYPVPGEAFIAGLLHDIGYQIFNQIYPDQFDELYSYAEQKKLPLYLAEKKLFNFDHSELGTWLAEGWNLPSKLVHTIRYHHHPEKAKKYNDLVKIIHVADLVGSTIQEENGSHTDNVKCRKEIIQKIKRYLDIDGYSLEDYQNIFRLECHKIPNFKNLSELSEIKA
jgi:putative nucleotidyltransferase with HDIG domain